MEKLKRKNKINRSICRVREVIFNEDILHTPDRHVINTSSFKMKITAEEDSDQSVASLGSQKQPDSKEDGDKNQFVDEQGPLFSNNEKNMGSVKPKKGYKDKVAQMRKGLTSASQCDIDDDCDEDLRISKRKRHFYGKVKTRSRRPNEDSEDVEMLYRKDKERRRRNLDEEECQSLSLQRFRLSPTKPPSAIYHQYAESNVEHARNDMDRKEVTTVASKKGKKQNIGIQDLDNYCCLCDKVFKNLKVHHLAKHKHTDLSCPFCSKQTPLVTTLWYHVNTYHAGKIGKIRTTNVAKEKPLPIQGKELYKLLQQYLVVSEDEYIIRKKNFVLSFDRGRKICKWAFESNTADCFASNVTRVGVECKAYEPLGPDQMSTSQILSLEGRYDAGHMIPAISNISNMDDLKDTYIYPNLVPMDERTNKGKWKACEHVAKGLLSEGSLWKRINIITGPVISEANKKMTFTGNMYYIPTHFYKIVIMDNEDGKEMMQCFLIPNDGLFDNVYRYLTTLDVIKEKTGINFTDKCYNILLAKDLKTSFRCTTCQVSFLTKSEKEMHTETHKGVLCYECKQVFKDKEDLAKHREEFHERYTCPHCSKVICSKQSFQKHMITHQPKLFICQIGGCGRAFSTKTQRRRHAVIHSDKRNYTCKLCDYSARSQRTMRSHVTRIHHLRPPLLRQSYDIVDISSDEKESDGHESKTHENVNVQPEQCDQCGFLAPSAWDLKKHMRIHNGETPFACPFKGCGKGFRIRGALTVHIRIHTGDKRYKCPKCDYAAVQRSSLMSHIASTHASALIEYKKSLTKLPRMHKCPICDRECASHSNMNNHIYSHTREKPFFCPVKKCGKEYVSNSLLKRHGVTHSGEKPYKCTQCSYGTTAQSYLNRHIKRMHQPDKEVDNEEHGKVEMEKPQRKRRRGLPTLPEKGQENHNQELHFN